MSKEEIICLSCGLINDYTITVSGMHHKATCNGCDKFIKFVSYAPPTFYFGKYQGVKVSDCQDAEYMKWYLHSVKRIPNTLQQSLEDRIKEIEKL